MFIVVTIIHGKRKKPKFMFDLQKLKILKELCITSSARSNIFDAKMVPKPLCRVIFYFL